MGLSQRKKKRTKIDLTPTLVDSLEVSRRGSGLCVLAAWIEMSFNTSRLLNKGRGQRLPASISQFEAAFKSMRSLKPEVQLPFPVVQSSPSPSPALSLDQSLSESSQHTNWRYVRMRHVSAR